MCRALNLSILKALIVPALSLALVTVVVPPSEVHRKHSATPKQIIVLGAEKSDAPPVGERQDGPLPPNIFP